VQRAALLRVALMVVVLLVAIASASESAVILAEGDWIVADPDANAVYRVDPGTFEAVEISSGGRFRYPSGVAYVSGYVIVADPDANAVFRVNPLSGSQTIVSSNGLFRYPTGVGIADNGDLLVADPVAGAVFRVDPSDGSQSLEYASDAVAFGTDVVGQAGTLLFVVDPDSNVVWQADSSIPAEEDFSNNGFFRYPTGASQELMGDLLVADPVADSIIRVNMGSGVQTPELEGTGFLYPSDIEFVPEPASIVLVGAGVALLAMLGRQRRARQLRVGHQGHCAVRR